MTGKRYAATLRRTLRAPRDFVWALVADTNRWNRASGLAAGNYEWKLVDGRRQYVGRAKELGQSLVWYEPPYEWSEGYFIEGERRFLEGPAQGGGLSVTLADGAAGTTVVDATSWFAGDGALLKLLGPVVRRRNLAALGRYPYSRPHLPTGDGEPAGESRPALQFWDLLDLVVGGPCPSEAVAAAELEGGDDPAAKPVLVRRLTAV